MLNLIKNSITKKTALIILIIAIVFPTDYAFSGDITHARVTIILTDKEGNPKPNLAFDLLNPDGTLRDKAVTNDKGEFKTKLNKGVSYIAFFKAEGKEWNFYVDIPNKPGRRAYKFSFKIYLKETREVAFKSTSDFDVKGDKTICEVTIAIRDQTGMVLPSQPFEIYTKDNSFRENLISDSEGKHKITLTREKRYDLISDIEGYKFSTYFEIAHDVEKMNFIFDINFDKITHTFIDTASDEKNKPAWRDVRTFIKVVNKQGEVQESAEVIVEESNRRVFYEVTKESGVVETMTDRRKVYEVFARKFGRTFAYEMVLPQDTAITEFVFVVVVDFTKKPKRKFRLNAYFDTAKWDLRDESLPDLNMLLKMMQDNLKMIIEIEGHTDSRDTEQRNQILSELRANSVQIWLTERGIDEVRITHIGYGENMPAATNKTKQGRQLNRRIEVAIMDE
ncbi:OmpA family protein [Bacteroidota bacterium]